MNSSTELPDWGQKHENSPMDEIWDQLQFFVTSGINSERSDRFFRDLSLDRYFSLILVLGTMKV